MSAETNGITIAQLPSNTSIASNQFFTAIFSDRLLLCQLGGNAIKPEQLQDNNISKLQQIIYHHDHSLHPKEQILRLKHLYQNIIANGQVLFISIIAAVFHNLRSCRIPIAPLPPIYPVLDTSAGKTQKHALEDASSQTATKVTTSLCITVPIMIDKKKDLDPTPTSTPTYLRIPVEADGNCFFYAIIEHLNHYEINYENLTHKKLRAKVVDFIRDNPDIFKSFIYNELNGFENYLKQMSKNKTYADENVIKACTEILKTTITVIYGQGRKTDGKEISCKKINYTPEDTHPDSIDICLVYEYGIMNDEGTAHYETLILQAPPTNKKSPISIPDLDSVSENIEAQLIEKIQHARLDFLLNSIESTVIEKFSSLDHAQFIKTKDFIDAINSIDFLSWWLISLNPWNAIIIQHPVIATMKRMLLKHSKLDASEQNAITQEFIHTLQNVTALLTIFRRLKLINNGENSNNRKKRLLKEIGLDSSSDEEDHSLGMTAAISKKAKPNDSMPPTVIEELSEETRKEIINLADNQKIDSENFANVWNTISLESLRKIKNIFMKEPFDSELFRTAPALEKLLKIITHHFQKKSTQEEKSINYVNFRRYLKPNKQEQFQIFKEINLIFQEVAKKVNNSEPQKKLAHDPPPKATSLLI